MNEPVGAARVTPYEAIGRSAQLRSEGIHPPSFQLDKAPEWTREETRLRRQVIAELAAVGESLGVPIGHSWRGVRADALLPADIDRLHSALVELLPRLEAFVRDAQGLGNLVGRQPETGEEVDALLALVRIVLSAPPLDPSAFGDAAWVNKRQAIRELVANGVKYSECQTKLAKVVVSAAWDTDFTSTSQVLASVGRRWWRFLSSEYRAARRHLTGMLRGPPPRGIDAQLYILDTIAAGQKARDHVVANDELGAAAFGSSWSSGTSQWEALARIDTWESEHQRKSYCVDLHAAVKRCTDQDNWRNSLDRLERDEDTSLLS